MSQKKIVIDNENIWCEAGDYREKSYYRIIPASEQVL
jgi:hypothetical protein